MKNKKTSLIITCAALSFTLFSMQEEREEDPRPENIQMDYSLITTNKITAKKKSCWPSDLCPQFYDEDSNQCRKTVTKGALAVGGFAVAAKLFNIALFWCTSTSSCGPICKFCLVGNGECCESRPDVCVNSMVWGSNGIAVGGFMTALGAWLPCIKKKGCCSRSSENNE